MSLIGRFQSLPVTRLFPAALAAVLLAWPAKAFSTDDGVWTSLALPDPLVLGPGASLVYDSSRHRALTRTGGVLYALDLADPVAWEAITPIGP
ncbi:MAG TPA: hypothetical protein VF720_05055, partial [Candidatus Eisenbacteria bacterium]